MQYAVLLLHLRLSIVIFPAGFRVHHQSESMQFLVARGGLGSNEIRRTHRLLHLFTKTICKNKLKESNLARGLAPRFRLTIIKNDSFKTIISNNVRNFAQRFGNVRKCLESEPALISSSRWHFFHVLKICPVLGDRGVCRFSS